MLYDKFVPEKKKIFYIFLNLIFKSQDLKLKGKKKSHYVQGKGTIGQMGVRKGTRFLPFIMLISKTVDQLLRFFFFKMNTYTIVSGMLKLLQNVGRKVFCFKFGLVTLFNGISTFVGYLIPKSIL